MSTVPRPLPRKSSLIARAERFFAASPMRLYDAWTMGIDRWFAQAGTVSMRRDVGSAWFFYNRDDWGRHPHYGRFLSLEPGRLIETTWLTGDGSHEGTWGAETILKIQLSPVGEGSKLRLTHAGFVSEESCEAHQENWPIALDQLAEALKSG